MAKPVLGLAALGRPAYINLGREGALPAVRDVESMRAHCHRVLDTAYELGVTWVDAARSYGLAEQFLSEWMPAHGDVTVCSKWGYAYVADWRSDAEVHEVKEHSLARFTQQWRETSALLEQVDLYQVHSLTADSPLFEDRALQEAMLEIDPDIGFTTSGPRQADTIRKALELGIFKSVQSTWNLLETSAGAALREAADAGLAVIVKEGVANGRLVVEPPPAVVAQAKSLGVGVDAVALAAIAQQPWVHSVVSGAASPEQLRSNLDAFRVEVDLPDLAEPAEEYWKTRSGLAWN